MLAAWHRNLESLEAISQDRLARQLFCRLAALARVGRLEPFLEQLHRDEELDDKTKRLVREIAEDSTFLHAVDDYLHRTVLQH